MKTDTELLNGIARESSLLRQLTEEECAKLKLTLLRMLKDIVSLCEEQDITIMLGGGSCLGAIRHKGFIPWDDDLDLMMPRADYERLKKLYEDGKVGERYLFMYPNPQKDVKNAFLKIYLKNTVCKEIFDDNDDFPTNVFLDVFPMDYAPSNRLIRRIKAFTSDVFLGICTCTLYSQHRSRNMEIFTRQDNELWKRYRLRLLIGRLFSFTKHRKWVYWFDCFHAKSKKTSYMTIPTGRNHYMKESLPVDNFLPVKEVSFGGEKAYVPGCYDAYLKRLYGDYMQIPPVQKRERHFIVEFRL